MSDDVDNQQPEDDWAAAMEEQAGTKDGSAEVLSAAAVETADVKQATMDNLVADTRGKETNVELEAILDIPVSLSVRIGKTRLNIRNLLQLNQGSVVELDRLAGEPLDVLVNDTLVAHGEVVVVNEKYGIRMTDIVSAHERIKKLQ